MKEITLSELNQVNPHEECFIIKNVFSGSRCYEAVDTLAAFWKGSQENERIRGDNWHYTVRKKNITFESFIFNDLKQLADPVLTPFYETLFNLYVAFGESFPIKAFAQQTGSMDDPEVKTITPLVFWYPAGVGKFSWHRHPGDYQDFQLLTNLTRPGIDYNGGETLVKMDDETTEIFDARFEQGDVFGFPYTRWHMVNPVLAGNSALNSRVSLLMPLTPRKGIKTYYANAEDAEPVNTPS